jgi:hypothetical protein
MVSTATSEPLRSDEGAPILDREDRKTYTFEVIPRKEMMEIPEEDLAAYLVRLKGLAEIIDEVVVGADMLRKTREADLQRRIKEAEEKSRQDKDDAVRLEQELEAKKIELQRELEARTAAAERNAQEAEELRQKLAKLTS